MSPNFRKPRAHFVEANTLDRTTGVIMAELYASGKVPTDAIDITFVPGGVEFNRKPQSAPAEPTPAKSLSSRPSVTDRQIDDHLSQVASLTREGERLKAEIEKLERSPANNRKGFAAFIEGKLARGREMQSREFESAKRKPAGLPESNGERKGFAGKIRINDKPLAA